MSSDGVMRLTPRGWVTLDRVVLVLAPVIVFWFQGFEGLSDTDPGFLTGISYRLLRGQELYTDIIYVRPPLSPILHAGVLKLLPDHLGLIGERALFYVLAWTSCLLALLTLRHAFGRDASGVAGLPLSIIGTLAFLFSVNNFTPYPWHTLDGVFFSALGLFLVVRSPSTLGLACAMLACLAAAACKQSYYPIPLVAVFLAGACHGRPGLIRSTVSLIVLSTVTLGGAAALYPESTSAFWKLSRAATHWDEAISAGFTKYLQTLPFVFGFVALGWLVKRRVGDATRTELLLWSVVLVALGLNIVEAYQNWFWQKTAYKYSQFLFLLAFGVAAFELRHYRQRAITLMALLSIAWCSSLSWGTKHPILFFTPVVFGVVHGVRVHLGGRTPVWAYRGWIVVLFGAYLAMAQFPRFDAPRWECTHALSEVFPRASAIQVGGFQFQHHTELMHLVAKYGEPFVVLPALPLAHYLTETTPILSVDWALNVEVTGYTLKAQLLAQLEQPGVTALIQRHRIDRVRRRGDHPYGSWLTLHVVDHWTLVETRESFLVYQMSTLPSSLQPAPKRTDF